MPNPPFPRRYDCLHHGAGHAVYPNSALRAQEPGVGWEKVTGLAFDGAFITSDTRVGRIAAGTTTTPSCART